MERLVFALEKSLFLDQSGFPPVITFTLPMQYLSPFAGIETFGKNAVVCGRSKNVGMPLAMLLHADGIGETEACKFGYIYVTGNLCNQA